MHRQIVRIGTRGSELARWQADFVAGLLRAGYPKLQVEISVFSTRGDQVLDSPLPLIGGKGLFTAELESALRAGQVDLAVHSLKGPAYPRSAGIDCGRLSHPGQRTRCSDQPDRPSNWKTCRVGQ